MNKAKYLYIYLLVTFNLKKIIVLLCTNKHRNLLLRLFLFSHFVVFVLTCVNPLTKKNCSDLFSVDQKHMMIVSFSQFCF